MLGDASFWNGIGWTALTSIVTSSVVAGLLQVVLKARYDERLARRVAELTAQNSTTLERLKAELTAENARDLERTRGDAAREAERFKQRFSLLATRQAEAAITLAERLAVLDLAARRLTMPVNLHQFEASTPKERFSQCEDARWAAIEFIDAKRLLFPKDICVLADDIIKRANEAEATLSIAPFPEQRSPEDWKIVRKAWGDMVGPGAEAMAEMHDRLRDLLQGTAP